MTSQPEFMLQNFETNIFCVRIASSILVRLLVTWSAFGCRRNVIAIFLFSEWLIYDIVQCPPSTTMEVFFFLHLLWYILIEKRNFETNMF